MILRQYQIDAFTSKVFEGNPAAVCPLDAWLEDSMLQAIAAENNLSETAFFVPAERGYHLRWFTPLAEVKLCGHATLASAYVLFELHGHEEDEIRFETLSGELVARRDGERFVLDFPACPPLPCTAPAMLLEGLGKKPLEVLMADVYIAVYENEDDIRALAPDMAKLATLELRGVGVTAPGRETDFVSRYFAPKLGVPEDPVTGSLHCTLAPYWQTRLGKDSFTARQLSRRGGSLTCEIAGDRVKLGGGAVAFMEGEIFI